MPGMAMAGAGGTPGMSGTMMGGGMTGRRMPGIPGGAGGAAGMPGMAGGGMPGMAGGGMPGMAGGGMPGGMAGMGMMPGMGSTEALVKYKLVRFVDQKIEKGH